MSVTLAEVLTAARAGRAALTGETAGYLVLGAAERCGPNDPELASSEVHVGEDGSVVVFSPGRGAPAGAEPSLCSMLGELLAQCPQPAPALLRVAREPSTTRLSTRVEAALIPVNRAAARRAIARLHRDVARAKAQGGLAAEEVPGPAAPAAAPAAAPVVEPAVVQRAGVEAVLEPVVPVPTTAAPPSPPVAVPPIPELLVPETVHGGGAPAETRRADAASSAASLAAEIEAARWDNARESARFVHGVLAARTGAPRVESTTAVVAEAAATTPVLDPAGRGLLSVAAPKATTKEPVPSPDPTPFLGSMAGYGPVRTALRPERVIPLPAEPDTEPTPPVVMDEVDMTVVVPAVELRAAPVVMDEVDMTVVVPAVELRAADPVPAPLPSSEEEEGDDGVELAAAVMGQSLELAAPDGEEGQGPSEDLAAAPADVAPAVLGESSVEDALASVEGPSDEGVLPEAVSPIAVEEAPEHLAIEVAVSVAAEAPENADAPEVEDSAGAVTAEPEPGTDASSGPTIEEFERAALSFAGFAGMMPRRIRLPRIVEATEGERLAEQVARQAAESAPEAIEGADRGAEPPVGAREASAVGVEVPVDVPSPPALDEDVAETGSGGAGDEAYFDEADDRDVIDATPSLNAPAAEAEPSSDVEDAVAEASLNVEDAAIAEAFDADAEAEQSVDVEGVLAAEPLEAPEAEPFLDVADAPIAEPLEVAAEAEPSLCVEAGGDVSADASDADGLDASEADASEADGGSPLAAEPAVEQAELAPETESPAPEPVLPLRGVSEPPPAPASAPPAYKPRQSDVAELLAGFVVAEAKSLKEISRELKQIAGVAATPAAPPVSPWARR